MTSPNFWNKQGAFNIPTSPEPMKRPEITESEKLTQLREAGRFTTDSKHLGASPVSGLSHSVRPANVSDDVSKIVVDAVEFVVRRAFSKVFQKRFKGVFPSFANRHATCAVILIFVAFGICASLKHIVIGAIGSGLMLSSGVSVDSNAFDWKITRATGGCYPTLETCVSYQFFGSAFAPAKALTEYSSARGAMRWTVRDYCELAECSSDEGFSLGHNDGSFIVVSSGGSRLQPILAAFLRVNERSLNA